MHFRGVTQQFFGWIQYFSALGGCLGGKDTVNIVRQLFKMMTFFQLAKNYFYQLYQTYKKQKTGDFRLKIN